MKGSIREQGRGSWEVRVYLGRGPNGRKLYKSHTVKGTKRRAQSELNELLSKLQRGEYVAPSRTTVSEYLERWLTDYAGMRVGAKTLERYAEIVRTHLAPALGHHPLPKLQPLHIQAYYSHALQLGRRDGRGGLSAQTVLHHHRVLREALQQALRWQLLARNPADAVEPPHARRREMEVFDHREVERLLDAARGTRLAVPVLLAVTTGLRRGELLGLRWQDVDLEASKLAVRQSLEHTKAGLAFKQPKTQKGRRAVTLPPMAVDALRRHKADQAKERLLLGPAYADHGLVLARADGRPANPEELTRAFKRLTKKAGVRGLSLHKLRHTHATLLLCANVHPKIVSERLGHATVGITLDTYSHVLPNLQEEAARKIDALLARTGSHADP
jgi:integrase